MELSTESGIVFNSRDITERIRNQEELEGAKEAAEASSQPKSEFLATVSHEIRTTSCLDPWPGRRRFGNEPTERIARAICPAGSSASALPSFVMLRLSTRSRSFAAKQSAACPISRKALR